MERPSNPEMTTATAELSTHPAFWKSTFEEHGGAVLGYLVSRLGRRDLAEDLLQETFVRAIRAGALRDAAKVRSYLLSVAHRLVIDNARRKRPVLFSEMADDAPQEIANEEERRPDLEVDQARLEHHLEEALASLPEALRVTFRAAVLEQRPYDEIAAEHGWTLGRVRVNVHRARKRLITRLRDVLQVDSGESP